MLTFESVEGKEVVLVVTVKVNVRFTVLVCVVVKCTRQLDRLPNLGLGDIRREES